jgi:hypothetical protein
MRSIIAILLAPALAATLIWVLDLAQGPDQRGFLVPMIPVYLGVAYATALLPAALIMMALHAWQCLKLRHFVLTGLFLGLVSNFLLMRQAYLAVSMIGAVVGGLVWLISEWRPHGFSAK